MFNLILNKYDPKDVRSHGILKFFVDDLTENDKIAFVDSIFKKGSWILPTEISKSSDSHRLKEETKEKFLKIFNEWVNERYKYSSKISKRAKNPRLTIDLTSEFREILLSIKNLNFSPEIMLVLKKFFDNSNDLYLKTFFRNSLSVVIEEYSEKEIEFFFFYFSDEYNEKISANYCAFVNAFLQRLAYSYKIHDLTDSFLNQLNKLSISLKGSENKSNYSVLISIFLIDLITDKKLDLSDSKYNKTITETIAQLKKSDYANLDFFRFLKQFNYPFNNYDFSIEIDSFFLGFTNNISILKTFSEEYKKDILHHYLKLSNSYFETLLFFLEQLDEKEAETHFVKFVTLVDELRNSFMSLIWFDEFLNFKKIKGKIFSITSKGFEVKIDENIFNKNILLREPEMLLSEKAKSHYGFGFLHESSLGVNKSKQLKDLLLQNNSNNNVIDSEITSFYALDLNFSQSYKGKAIQFVPESKAINKILGNYELKALFVSIEIYLIEKAYKYLKSESPFLLKTNHFKLLCTADYIHNYNIGFTENTFWQILKKIRPSLYEALYIKHKKDEESFALIVSAFENQTLISGIIKSRTNGGMIVDVLDIEAFLPGSQIDIKHIINYDIYIEQKMQFKVIQINPELKNVVISHRIISEADINIKRKKIIDQLEKGQILEGVVKNITSFGVFIDLGGIDGLIHITDLTWSRINHANEILELDQKIKVVILDFDYEKTRIQLGLKQLYPDPWEDIDKKIKVLDNVPGKVLSIVDYGAIIEISEGLDGLVHINDLSWTRKIKNTSHFLKVGAILNFVILDIDKRTRKLQLGYKQQIEDPWDKLDFEKGSIHWGMVEDFVSKGAIVVFNNDVTAFIPSRHLRKLNGYKLKKGEYANFIVIEFDKNRKDIMVSHTNTFAKQLNSSSNSGKITTNIKYVADSDDGEDYSIEKDILPLESTFNNYNVGDITTGIVFEIADYGAYIKMPDGIESLIRVYEMSWNSQLCYAQDFMEIGDLVEVIITSINKDTKEIFSSIRQLKQDPWININSTYPTGSIHTGIVKKLTNFGIIVSLTKDIDGVIDTSIYKDKLIKNRFDFIDLGDFVDVEILKLDITDRKLFLEVVKKKS